MQINGKINSLHKTNLVYIIQYYNKCNWLKLLFCIQLFCHFPNVLLSFQPKDIIAALTFN